MAFNFTDFLSDDDLHKLFPGYTRGQMQGIRETQAQSHASEFEQQRQQILWSHLHAFQNDQQSIRTQHYLQNNTGLPSNPADLPNNAAGPSLNDLYNQQQQRVGSSQNFINSHLINPLQQATTGFNSIRNVEHQTKGYYDLRPHSVSRGFGHTLEQAKRNTQNYAKEINQLIPIVHQIRYNLRHGVYANSGYTRNQIKGFINIAQRGRGIIDYATSGSHPYVQETRSSKRARQDTQAYNKYVPSSRRRKLPNKVYGRSPGLSNSINRISAKYNNGSELYGEENLARSYHPGVVPTFKRGQSANSFSQSLKNAGIVPSLFTPFAARVIQASQRHGGAQSFHGFANSGDVSRGNQYLRSYARQITQVVGSLHQSLEGVNNMIQGIKGHATSRKHLDYIERRFNGLAGNNGSAKNSLSQLSNFLSGYHRYVQNRAPNQIRSDVDQLLKSGVLNKSDVSSNHQQVIGDSAIRTVRNTVNDNSQSSDTQAAASDYLNTKTELKNFAPVIANVRREFAGLSHDLSTVNSNMNNKKTGLENNLSTNPMSMGDPNVTSVAEDRGSRGYFVQKALTALFGNGISNMANTIRQNNASGNQIREQMAPNLFSQALGQSINGGQPQWHLDNAIDEHLNKVGQGLGYGPQQMAQNLNSLSGTRDTNTNDMSNAAIDEARFERYNNVDPQVAQQMFGTLGQAGGLGNHGNQVASNLSALSSQFSGMLNRDHLGAMGTQQAQGLNSIYSNMLGSGQTVTPGTAGNVMAMQSVLSHGPGGQVFQGQQGAQQLNAFSHGVGGAFNNQLIRNAFAGGMPQYGGQQGLYRLQMDMQEPLKHPTQLNNMIQGMSNIAGPSGAEDALTQMGLGPEAAKKIYHDAETGQLTQSNLSRIKRQDKNRGKSTQKRASSQYKELGSRTVQLADAIKANTKVLTSISADLPRAAKNGVFGPMANNPITALMSGGISGGVESLLSTGLNVGLPSALALLGHGSWHPFAHPINTFRSVGRGLFHGLPRNARALRYYGRSLNKTGLRGLSRAFRRVNGFSRAGKSVASGASRDASRMARLHPVRNFLRNHLGGNIGRSTDRATADTSRVAARAGSRGLLRAGARGLGRAAGPLGDAYIAYSDLKGMHKGNRGRKIGGALGDVGGGIAGGAALGTAFGGPVGTIVGGAAGAIGGGLLGKDLGSKIGGLFDHGSHTAHAATRRTGRTTLHTTYFWLRRINRLLPALAKKMSGFSDVDPSLAGNKSSDLSSETNNGSISSTTKSQSNTKPGTSNTPNSPSTNSGAKTYNGTGNQGVTPQDTNAVAIQPAQVSSQYFDATLGTTNNRDDHSNHEDSHNVYKNYITAPSQSYLSKLMENSKKAQDYFGHTHTMEWA